MAAQKRNKQKQERINEAVGVLFLLVGLFTLLSLLFFSPSDHPFYTSHPQAPHRNVTGILGVYVGHYFNFSLGLSAYSVPALFLFWASCFFLQKVPQKKWIEFLGIAVSIVAVSSLFSLLTAEGLKMRAGGVIGYFLAGHLAPYFGLVGSVIISVSCLALALLLATDFLLYPIFERWLAWIAKTYETVWSEAPKRLQFGNPAGKRKPKIAPPKEEPKFIPPKVKPYSDGAKKTELPAGRADRTAEPAAAKKTGGAVSGAAGETRLNDESAARNKPQKGKDEPVKSVEEDVPEIFKDRPISARPDEQVDTGNYEMPPLSLLKVRPYAPVLSEKDLHRNSKILEATLRDFGLEVKVVEVEQGPVITRYELTPAPGVKVNSIVSLSDDLALALKTTSVRFLTPIPGKAALGIEIPNPDTSTVFLRELLESEEVKKRKDTLPLMLGKDTSGKPLIADLSEMPHLLIAGSTGSGKTVCLNAVIAGFLYTKTPDYLRLIMVDPKMVELSGYRNLPHMMAPVVTDVRKAAGTLNWLVSEMERRYKILAASGMRNIKAFNERPIDGLGTQPGEEELPKRLPFIVLIIDELADLMLVARDKVENAITRLVQLARAVGIHLILATQRPSVDVITGVIKANFPARIAFKVASKVDSRTVLDVNGADQLIGKGDLLFVEPGEAKPTRGQGTFISDEEILAVVAFVEKQGKANYVPEMEASMQTKAQGREMEKDELYDEAVNVVLETRQASVSVLQRRLRLGYGRAARIIDMMEEEGIVGPLHGSKPREIFVDRVEETETEESSNS